MLTTINYFDKTKISDYNNVEVLYLAYNTLTELPNKVFSLPKLHTIAFGNEQMSQENWWKFISQISQNPQIKHLHLACYPHFPADITPTKQLISIEISFDRLANYRESVNTNKGISFEDFAKQLAQLSHLEELKIDLGLGYGGITDISTEVFNAIGNIKSLQNLQIGVVDTEHYHWKKLKHIKKLELRTNSTKFSEDFSEMESLEELHLQDVKLTHLHLTTELKNLHTIIFNFSYNKRYIKAFESVSNDYLRLLPQIKRLELNEIPKNGNTKLLTDLHQIFKQNNAQNNTQNNAQNELILDIITKTNTDKYTIEDLLSLLAIKKAQIDSLVWVILEKRLKENIENNIKNDGFDLEKVKTYFLLGQSTRSVDLRKILKSLNWKETKDSKKADCTVVSRVYAPAYVGANADTSNDFDTKKAISDTYLFAWAENKTGFERFDENMNANLLLLLKNSEVENQALGLDLLTNAYTSTKEINACLLAIALFSENKNLKAKTKKFIEKNLASNLLLEYKKNNKRGYDKENYENIKNLPQIDALCFAEVAFKIVKNKTRFETFGFIEILQLGGEMMPKAIELLQYYSSYVEIPLEITKLHPDFITHFPAGCKNIVCHNPFPEVQEVLFRLKNLKEIAFDYFREDFLHEDIGNMKSLEKIELNINIQKFPKNLSKLTQTKQLVVSNEEITTIPDVFSSWKNLENIRFFTKKLAEIPAWIADFKNLKTVQIFSIAEEINVEPLFEIENLEELYLRTVPFTFKNLNKNLKNFKKFSFNTTSTTNTNIALHNACLKELVSVLPEDLEEFTFESRSLNIIPDEIKKFTKLKKLVLSGVFDQIPACIADFPLETLSLQSDNLIVLPDFLKKITTLKLMELSRHFKKQEKKLKKMLPNVDFWI